MHAEAQLPIAERRGTPRRRDIARRSVGRRVRRCRVAVLPPDAGAADLIGGEAGVEGDLGGDGGEGVGGRGDACLVAERGGELGEHLPDRAHEAGAGDSGAQALQATVGMGDGALLLGVGLGREDDVGRLRGGVLEGRDREHGAGLVQRLGPARAVGQVADRVGVREDDAVELAVEQALLDLLEVAARLGVREPRSGAGQAADLAHAAGVAALGDREGAAAVGPAVERVDAVAKRVQRRGAVAAAAQRLTPDHQCPTRAELAGQPFGIGAVRALGGWVGTELGFKCGQELRRLARQIAGGLLGAAVERGRPLGGDHQPQLGVADGLAQAQVEDRHRVQRIGADQQHRLGPVDVGDRGAERRRRERGEPGAVELVECWSRAASSSASRTIRWIR